jgi:hypothetical protein
MVVTARIAEEDRKGFLEKPGFVKPNRSCSGK